MGAHLADLPTSPLRLADLASRKATAFELMPNAGERAAIAQSLGIIGIKKLTFKGEITPVGRIDWELRAKLGVTVVQACVVTLDPVTTRVDEPVTRIYTANFEEPDENEVEMLVDENVEPLPASVDLAEVMIEAVALALPPYPRSEGADLSDAVFTEGGKAPMTDEDAKPFAGLGDLRKTLENKDDTNS